MKQWKSFFPKKSLNLLSPFLECYEGFPALALKYSRNGVWLTIYIYTEFLSLWQDKKKKSILGQETTVLPRAESLPEWI